MVTIFRKYIVLLVCVFLGCSYKAYAADSSMVKAEDIELWQQLNQVVHKAMDKSGTPGVSIAIVNRSGQQILNYGYANLEEEQHTSENTLFELGSMSKAFTALGILYLEQEGDINLQDNVKEYLPWLTFFYDDEYKGEEINGEVPVTIRDFLYHTTGIPFETIGNIPEGSGGDMLELTVRGLIGTKLDYYPGTEHRYVTINYDILGLIIQEVTGKTYENFIIENILKPLGLEQTYLYRQEAAATEQLAAGYKAEFFQTQPYEAPLYRGNTPAGYIISNTSDMARWLQIQMGFVDIPEKYRDLIHKSHEIDSQVKMQDDYAYAAGWNVHIRGENMSHGGSNPNFSSMIYIDYEKEIGICILSNMNSNAPSFIAKNFKNLLYHNKLDKYDYDIYKILDTVFSLLAGVTIIADIFLAAIIPYTIIQILKRIRVQERLCKEKTARITIAIPIMVFWIYCIYYLPNILLERLSWNAVIVWGAKSILLGSISTGLAGVLFFVYVLLTFNFTKEGEKNYFTLTILSIWNGLASALIIFTINESFNRNLEYSRELFVYFLFALTFFVYTIKLVQGRLIIITNEIVYEKRVAIIDGVIGSDYSRIEEIGSARINSGLNNDANAIASMPEIMISLASNSLTLVFCLAYLLTKSLAAFLASTGVILSSCLVSLFTGKLATKYWKKNRKQQDTYYRQIADLVNGFKELLLGRRKRNAFWKEIRDNTRFMTELSKEASIKFLNFGIYNTLMYNIIFGVVVFIFPLLIAGISVNELRENLFLVFYLTGPFGQLMGNVPNLTKIKINQNKIDELIDELKKTDVAEISKRQEDIKLPEEICLTMDEVCFSYMGKEDNQESEEGFALGPISGNIRTGEITYIIGGNGSGKSTLGKLLTGLYFPQKGKILVNNEDCSAQALNSCFSAVFSDYYLFSKLYGVDMEKGKEEIEYLFKLLKMEGKIELDHEGTFSSLDLSSGQKKRLALIISILEHKPYLLFDEWAAEQDQEFRHYFYTQLLPLLKKRGKGVVVITHDDRFFHLADQIIKLERGKLVG